MPSRRRSLHIQVFFISCLQCINTSCTPFLRRHKPWIENHLPALSASQNRCEGLRLCVFCQTVSKLRSTVYPESLAEEVSNPSLKARRSMSTRHALPCGANHRVLHLCRASPCCPSHTCPSHTHKVPVVPFHHSQWLCYPSSPTTDIGARHSSSST